MTVIRRTTWSPLLLAPLLLQLAGCKPPAAPPQPPPPEVSVATVGAEPVALELTYAATTAGSREVEVRARVSGVLLQRRYEEGARVVQGQSLFQIDPVPIRARVAAARAQADVANARLEEARRQRERVVPLFEQNAVSQSRRDEVVSAFEVAQANLAAAKAELQTAQLDLEYSNVRAPISGVTSREMVSEGSLISVERDAMPLTRIAQVDPLYVEFAVPEAEAALLRTSLARTAEQAPQVRIVLEDNAVHPQPAKLTFIDTLVDRESGTVRARAVLPNPQAALLPGQFVRARLEGLTLQNVVAIPRKAVVSNAQGRFVWLLDADAKVSMQPVQVGRSLGNDVVVTQGLQRGDRYVLEGVLKLQPGIRVSAVPAEQPLRQAEGQTPPGAAPRATTGEAGKAAPKEPA
jgi:membrane fusion protein, multidrug efflux system